MSHVQKHFSFVLCLAAAMLAHGAASAKDAPTSCPSVTRVEREIVDHADQGMESLGSYVWRTSVVQRINMNDVKESLDEWRAAMVCQEQVARAGAQVELASKSAETGDR